ncbi:MAG: PP2C family protein-serine/threonine phosphatase [Acidobacteria bacterium]|nr:PP2C family protein-serine/threonine phosphatase [Acidobacteriota bacterium]
METRRATVVRKIWFHLLLAVGSLLGLLLLVQSIATYYQVSRILVTAELRRQALQQRATIERDSQRLGIREPAELSPVLKEIREEESLKIAWIRVIDIAGNTLIEDGTPIGLPIRPERLPRSADGTTSTSQIRNTKAGKVQVTLLQLRLSRRPPLPNPGARESGRRPSVRPVPWFIEIAQYRDSASTAFGRLRSDLAVSSLAALGLVGSMIVLWLRFPHYVRGKQLERQTELARQVQRDLLPSGNVVLEKLDFAAECAPAQQVGGDFYDAFSDGQGRIALVLGDVSGKGLPASVVVGLLLGAVRASGWMGGGAEHESASRRLSELLRTRTSLERFASLFWCYYESTAQVLHYVNAGHLPPMLVRRTEGGELEIQRLTEGGPVLGLLKDADYRQGHAAVRPGDLLVLYSDGVVEAESASGEQFDEARLLAVLRGNWGRTAAEIRDEMLGQVHKFLDKGQAQDDLTLVVVRVASPRVDGHSKMPERAGLMEVL